MKPIYVILNCDPGEAAWNEEAVEVLAADEDKERADWIASLVGGFVEQVDSDFIPFERMPLLLWGVIVPKKVGGHVSAYQRHNGLIEAVAEDRTAQLSYETPKQLHFDVWALDRDSAIVEAKAFAEQYLNQETAK